MLSLRHVAGAEATWLLDADLRRFGDSVMQVPDGDRTALYDRAHALLGLVFERIITAPWPEPTGDAEDLTGLCEATLNELAVPTTSVLAPGMLVVSLDDPAADTVLEPFGLRAAALRATLAGSLPEAFRHRMRHGALLRPSPFDGRPVEAEVGMPLNQNITAYRFSDRMAGHCFYLTAQDYHDRMTGLFLPGLRLYCVANWAPDLQALLGMLLVHAAQHQWRLRRYLQLPPADRVGVNLVSDYPTLHIGHVVWNELSGLQELVGTVETRFLPLVCVLASAHGSEAFGPLDVLFPEFAGKVVRPDVPWGRAAAHIYDNGWFLMRYKTRYIHGRTGARIRALVAADPILTRDRLVAACLADEGRTVILLGIRVGNRTLVDIAGFLSATINHLLDRLGRVAIVIDGTNNRLGLDASTSYASFGPPGGDEPLIEELRVVFDLRRRYGASGDVEIISTVGAPMSCGLFWATHCRFFIAPWGAALAKYRWVCNRPGFVVSNRFNIGQPTGDLPIYHHPEYVEDPSPMRIVALEHVLDVPGPAGFYANFDIAPEGLRAGIDEMIALTAPS